MANNENNDSIEKRKKIQSDDVRLRKMIKCYWGNLQSRQW